MIDEPEKLDVYSLGIMIFHLVFKHYPFPINSYEDQWITNDPNFVAKFIYSEKNTHKVFPSKDFIDLLQHMLMFNPNERISMS
jgi:serine/threonine protein kinase